MKFHVDARALLDARDVRRNGELVVVREVGEVVIPAPATSGADGVENDMVVGPTAKTKILLNLSRDRDKSVLRSVDHCLECGECPGKVRIGHDQRLVLRIYLVKSEYMENMTGLALSALHP